MAQDAVNNDERPSTPISKEMHVIMQGEANGWFYVPAKRCLFFVEEVVPPVGEVNEDAAEG